MKRLIGIEEKFLIFIYAKFGLPKINTSIFIVNILFIISIIILFALQFACDGLNKFYNNIIITFAVVIAWIQIIFVHLSIRKLPMCRVSLIPCHGKAFCFAVSVVNFSPYTVRIFDCTIICKDSEFYLNSVSKTPKLKDENSSFPFDVPGFSSANRIAYSNDEKEFSCINAQAIRIRIETPLFINKIEHYVSWDKLSEDNNEK